MPRVTSKDSEEAKSYAVGHFALGYLLAKASAKLGKVELNIPVVLTLAIIPDVDLLFPMIPHRGPSHSIIVIGLIFVPIFAAYRGRAIPYLLALIQHFMIGDYLASGQVQLLWPITTQYYGTNLSIRSPVNIAAESAAFVLSIIVMLRVGEIGEFLKPHMSNLILAVPLFTVLLPAFLSFPLDVPVLLMPQHLFYTILFTLAIISTLHKTAKTVMTRRYSGSPSFLLNSE